MTPTNPLPAPARQALMQAAKVGQPGSFLRVRALDEAIRVVRLKYPQFFKPQQ